MNKRLGRILLENRLITTAQLEEAIQNQVIYGGKLGTNLLELGYINLAVLSKVLARKHGCPTINPFQLKQISRDVLRLVSKKLAVKHHVIPLGTDGKTLDLLMCDPSDVPTLDDMRFATGKHIRPFVTPEVVLLALIEKYYGVESDYRYEQLALKVLTRPAPATPNETKAQAAAKSHGHPEIKGLEFDAKEDLTSPEEFEKLLFSYNRPHGLEEGAPANAASPPPTPPVPSQASPQPPTTPPPPTPQAQPQIQPPPPPQPIAEPPPPQTPAAAEKPAATPQRAEPAAPVEPPQPEHPEVEEEEEPEEILEELPEALTLKEALDRLLRVNDRDELSRTVLAFALSYFKRAALFITRGGVALGWDGMGGSVNRRNVQSVMLPLNSPSIFKTVHDSSSFFLGAIPPTPINERFLKLIGGEKPRSVFLIPILFGGKVVNILYGDNGNAADAPTDISELLILAPRLPMVFEALIKRKKQDTREQG